MDLKAEITILEHIAINRMQSRRGSREKRCMMISLRGIMQNICTRTEKIKRRLIRLRMLFEFTEIRKEEEIREESNEHFTCGRFIRSDEPDDSEI